MEDFLSAVVLIASSTVLIFMNVFFWNACSKLVLKTSSNTFFADLLFSLFCLRIILYYVLPTITHLLLNWKNQNIDRVLPSEISTVYMVEVFSHFIYYITFYILCKRNKKDLSLIIRVDKTLKKIMLGILLLYVCFLLNNTQIISLSFCDSLWMFEPLISLVGSVACFFIVAIGSRYWGNTLFVIACLVTLVYLLIGFASGIRGKLFWPVFWVLFCAYSLNRSNLKKMLLISVILLGALGLFQGGMTFIRSNKSLDIIEIIQSINNSKNDGERSLLDEIDFRFGALTHYSTGFYRMVDRGYMAGWNPILNSLYSPIPRSLMEDKPVPCSVDGDLYSMGMYKTQAEITHIDTNMVEFSTAAHAYWELHIFGLILFSIIPAIYVFLSIKLFRQFALLAPCFLMVVFKPWGYNDPKIWVSEIFLQLSQVIIPALFILLFYSSIRKRTCK